MKILTEILGEVEIEQRDIIAFPSGILAFEEYKEYVLLDIPTSPSLKLFQSINEKSINFLVINPFEFFPDYEFEIGKGEEKKLELEDATDLATFVILTVGNSLKQTTANLLGPLVINSRNKIGIQFIIQDGQYNTKVPLLRVPFPPSKGGL